MTIVTSLIGRRAYCFRYPGRRESVVIVSVYLTGGEEGYRDTPHYTVRFEDGSLGDFPEVGLCVLPEEANA